jgi:hypothetical protein
MNNLPHTGTFGALLEEQEFKQDCLPENLDQLIWAWSNDWRNPMQDDRHIHTRFLVHGFHFEYCMRTDFHETTNDSVCKFVVIAVNIIIDSCVLKPHSQLLPN